MLRIRLPLLLALALMLLVGAPAQADPGDDADALAQALADSPLAAAVQAQLEAAGDNRAELTNAILQAQDDEQRASVLFLVAHMPAHDAKALSAEFVLENVKEAHAARAAHEWAAAVPWDVFRNDVLPYACLNERRDNWRADFRKRFAPMVAEATNLREAFIAVARKIKDETGVSYNTKRRKPDQSPYESMEQGMASCTGLAILLVDACRAVGIPARVAGVPQWTKVAGNHTWTEVWIDGRFMVTEYGGTALDGGWFLGRCAEADGTRRMTRIYATSWKPTGDWFPLAWNTDVKYVHATDVTRRYRELWESKQPAPQSQPAPTTVELLVVVKASADGDRVPTMVRVLDAEQTELGSGETRGPENDLNDMLAFQLPPDADVVLEYAGPDGRLRRHTLRTGAVGDIQRVELRLDNAADLVPLTCEQLLAAPESDLAVPLEDATARKAELWAQYLAEQRANEQRLAEHRDKKIAIGDAVMRYESFRVGDRPDGGYPLYIALHGGGGAPAAVNDGQWRHMQIYYRTSVKQGIYVAPRGMSNTWNLHFVGPSYAAYDRLIENMVIFEGVDPDRVYILGFSAGGDGAYQIAPRMADRWAAANASAGHPNGVQMANLYNLPFLNQVGERDTAYGRHRVAPAYCRLLDELQRAHGGGYVHETFVHVNRPHNFADNDPRMGENVVLQDPVGWLETGRHETVRRNTNAIAWLREHTRDALPKKVVWQPGVGSSRPSARRFYWLDLGDDTDIQQTGSHLIVARIDRVANAVIVESSGTRLRLLLHESMLDLSQPVTVRIGGQTLVVDVTPRLRVMLETMLDRSDPRHIFDAAITLELRGGIWRAKAE